MAVSAVTLTASALAAFRQTATWRNSGSLFAHMERNPHFREDPLQAALIYIMWAKDEHNAGRAEHSSALFRRAYDLYMDTMRAAVAAGDYARAWEVSEYMADLFVPGGNLRRELSDVELRDACDAARAGHQRRPVGAGPDTKRRHQAYA